MKRILKIIGILISSLLLIGLVAFLYINYSGLPTYPVEPIQFQAESSPEILERGKKLATVLCASCHKSEGTNTLTGGIMKDAPAVFGEIYVPNITQDKKFGIGSWTDAELLYLLRTGIKKDGAYAPPYMAKLPLMADADINAIIAFLRSDDPMVKANPTPDQVSKPGFLTKFLCKVAWKPFPMPDSPIAMPDTNNTVELGEYLAHNLDCYSCHSASFKTNNYLEPTLSEGYFGGGNELLDRMGRPMVTSNLTPDKETGIGLWNKTEFIRAVKYGVVKDESALAYPMLPYSVLTDSEAGAIYDYLQTIPSIKNKIERTIYE